MFVPLSFSIGSVVLTPTRVVLAISLVINCPRFFGHDRKLPDLLVLAHVGWVTLSFGVVGGALVAAKSGGAYVVDFLGAYSLARFSVKSIGQAMGLIRTMAMFVVLTFPFTCAEFISGHCVFDSILGGAGLDAGKRFGFTRAHGPFEHPILYGGFCASQLGAFWYGAGDSSTGFSTDRKRLQSILLIGAAMFSLSSAALISIVIQGALRCWDRLTYSIPRRWVILCSVLAAFYGCVGLFSSRSLGLAILDHVTFSQESLYYRTNIFKYGIESVYSHPLFGIGFNDWDRPDWMKFSGTVDNFWLLIAMRHGVLGFITLMAAALGSSIFAVRSNGASQISLGITISVISLTLIGGTVHLWGPLFMYYSLLLGLANSVHSSLDKKRL